MPDNHTILNYVGPIDFNTTESLLHKVKDELEGHDIKKVFKKRVYKIMVECIENILRHNTVKSDNGLYPYIELVKEAKGYLIKVSNLVQNTDVDRFKRHLFVISNQNNEGLRNMYENQINKKDILEEDGAGLGIITIAMNSNNNINYTFRKMNEKFSVYELEVVVQLDKIQ